jgi:hypothetical protein
MEKDDKRGAWRQPKNAIVTASIEGVHRHGERLLDDAMQVEFQKPPCTKLVLSMIAQEEFAKAFILYLVRSDVVPWNGYLLRAMNDHVCKQLMGVVIVYRSRVGYPRGATKNYP